MPNIMRIFDVPLAVTVTGAHAAGDTVFIPTACACLSTPFRNMGRARLDSIVYSVNAAVDPALVVYIFADFPTIGIGNAAFALTQVQASTMLLGQHAMGAAVAVGAGRTLSAHNLGIALESDDTGADAGKIWVAGATTGTPTLGVVAHSLRLGITYLED